MLVAVRMAVHLQAHLPLVLVNAARGKSLLLAYLKEIVGLTGKMTYGRKEQPKGPKPYS